MVVDTGVSGSAGAIEDSLTGVGLDWSAVGHLILTHRHNDHIGSAAEVMAAAPDAAAYAGAEDIAAISVPRPTGRWTRRVRTDSCSLAVSASIG